jgi:uncharacterized membrane protein
MRITALDAITSPGSTTTQQQAVTHRINAIDIVRGYAMILMLISHSSWLVDGLDFSVSRSWFSVHHLSQSMTPLQHSLGLILQIATPTFFLLAGFSIAFFQASRRRQGWSEWRITHFLLIRMGLLLALDWLLLAGLNPYFDHYMSYGFAVLTGIALCIGAMAFLRRLSLPVLAMVGLALLIAIQIVYNTVPTPQDTNILRAALLYSGPANPVPIGFPLLGWLPVVILGFISGTYIRRNPGSFNRYCLWTGGVLLASWLTVTALNIGRIEPGELLIFTRDPPALDYLLLYVGIAFLLLYGQNRLFDPGANGFFRIIRVIGQTALFFFVMHAFVVFFAGTLITLLPITRPLVEALVTSAVAFAILYLICRAYRRLRRRNPGSVLEYI